MADRLRPDTPDADTPNGAVDRDTRIEQLLLEGLDHYFAGRYELAISVWTRVLFLDRAHRRARAYIERARSAVAERQRESEELIHRGMAAFDSGDTDAARQLLTSAVESTGPHDVALALLSRIDRLEAPSPAAVATVTVDRAPGARSYPEVPAPLRQPAARRRLWILPLVTAFAVGVGVLGASFAWQRLVPFFANDWQQLTTAGQAVAIDEPLPLPRSADIALTRAKALFASGRLRDALRALDRIQPGDPTRAEADRLRGDIQRALMADVAPARDATSPR